MNVILAKSAGFCWGVRRAVRKARQLAKEDSAPIYTDGPLIHNKEMMDRLKVEGITEAPDPGAVPPDGILLIRAHGIPPERKTALNKISPRLVDSTCPDVAKIQALIERYSSDGFSIIIFGDAGHAEVVGLLGHAHGKGFVVSNPADIKTLPEMRKVCVVSQSTQFPNSYRAISDTVSRRFPDAIILDTICSSTKNRQRELVEISETVDAIVVVGGSHSANTVRLVELAKTLRPTFHIQTSGQLNKDAFRKFRTVGLTAGASTPAFIIEDVKATLEGMNEDRA